MDEPRLKHAQHRLPRAPELPCINPPLQVPHGELHHAIQLVGCGVDGRLFCLAAAVCTRRGLQLLLPACAVLACCCERCWVVEAVMQLQQVVLVLLVAVWVDFEVDETLEVKQLILPII
jgi:hypothetical protein